VEGMSHEKIYASGIYFIAASENILYNHLSFRYLHDEDEYHDEYGRDGELIELVEDLGKANTPTGTVLVWNNVFQHQVGPLTVQHHESNEQPTKKQKSTTAAVPSMTPPVAPSSGIRKILCFFLVSPMKRIVSTKIVPEQQNILSFEEAMKHKQHLMNKRELIAKRDARDWESRTYTFGQR
jgi:hypothetical protein